VLKPKGTALNLLLAKISLIPEAQADYIFFVYIPMDNSICSFAEVKTVPLSIQNLRSKWLQKSDSFINILHRVKRRCFWGLRTKKRVQDILSEGMAEVWDKANPNSSQKIGV